MTRSICALLLAFAIAACDKVEEDCHVTVDEVPAESCEVSTSFEGDRASWLVSFEVGSRSGFVTGSVIGSQLVAGVYTNGQGAELSGAASYSVDTDRDLYYSAGIDLGSMAVELTGVSESRTAEEQAQGPWVVHGSGSGSLVNVKTLGETMTFSVSF